ncbi:MAG: 16S rRNA (cytidine(1402)-2'-O)-methyltransferase [Caldimonas sp.]
MNTPDASLLLQAAAAASGDQTYPTAALYVVATPIGNRADITLRALHVLSLVDAIACEDTRHSQPLLRQFGIDKPLLALHQHNEVHAAGAVLQRLAGGERIAYVSDAGTPAVSDPGAALVAAVQAAGYPTLPIPGASSALALLSVAGDTGSGGFRVLGFLPSKGAQRARAIADAATAPIGSVLFEAPHRIVELAQALAGACPARRVTVGRELTKQFETVVTMAASALPAWLAADTNRLRGEFVVMLHGAPAALPEHETSQHDVMLRTLLGVLPLRQAVSTAVALSGASKNLLYDRALQLKNQAD